MKETFQPLTIEFKINFCLPNYVRDNKGFCF